MATKNQVDSKKEETKKKTHTSNNTKKGSTKTNSVKKTNATKTASAKKNTNMTTKKNSTKTNLTKKTTTVKKSNVKNTVKEQKEKIEDIKVKNVELANVLEKDEVIKTKEKKRNNKLLFIGIFIVILGIIALFISLIANRIVDREFLSDNAITFMIITSIIIEGFGSFIIINEA